MSLTLLCESVKDPLEAERSGSRSWWDAPIIPFIPEKPNSTMAKDEFIEVALKADRSVSVTGTLNTIKKTVRKYSHGPIEDLLRWKMNLLEVISEKPIISALSKFSFAEMMLGGDPLITFRDLRRSVCHSEPVNGVEPGETDGTFNSVVNRFVTHYFPKVCNPSKRQKKYMRTYLRKPKTVQVKQIAERLIQMNGYLPFFPDAYNSKFDEDELIENMITMCPQKWRTEMARMNFEPADHNFLQVQTCLETIEMIEATESLSLNRKRKGTDKEKGSDRYKTYPGKGDRKSKEDSPPCALCKALGGNAESHPTSKCNKKKLFEANRKTFNKSPNKKWEKKKEEQLNAVIARKVKKNVKKHFKRCGINYQSSSEESKEGSGEE